MHDDATDERFESDTLMLPKDCNQCNQKYLSCCSPTLQRLWRRRGIRSGGLCKLCRSFHHMMIKDDTPDAVSLYGSNLPMTSAEVRTNDRHSAARPTEVSHRIALIEKMPRRVDDAHHDLPACNRCKRRWRSQLISWAVVRNHPFLWPTHHFALGEYSICTQCKLREIFIGNTTLALSEYSGDPPHTIPVSCNGIQC